ETMGLAVRRARDILRRAAYGTARWTTLLVSRQRPQPCSSKRSIRSGSLLLSADQSPRHQGTRADRPSAADLGARVTGQDQYRDRGGDRPLAANHRGTPRKV